MRAPDLPRIDEHTVDVAAPADAVWHALLALLDRAFSGAASSRYARAIRCDPPGASGPRPLQAGSTVPGFRVDTVIDGTELVLRGKHRFSVYALSFRLEAVAPNRTRVRAESRGVFPGGLGAAYRLLVIRTGAHVVAVHRLLRQVRRRAEGASR